MENTQNLLQLILSCGALSFAMQLFVTTFNPDGTVTQTPLEDYKPQTSPEKLKLLMELRDSQKDRLAYTGLKGGISDETAVGMRKSIKDSWSKDLD